MKILINENNKDVKAMLSKMLINIIAMKGWSQASAAKILDIDQPKISQLKNGKIEGFSLERLIKFLVKVDCRVFCDIELPEGLESDKGAGNMKIDMKVQTR